MGSFLRSVIIKRKGGSKVVYIPMEWEMDAGTWILLKVARPSEKYPLVMSTRIRSGRGTKYVIIPPDWDFTVGEVVDCKISYADVPRPVVNANPGTDTQEED